MDTIANQGPATLEQKLDDLKALGYSGLNRTGTDVHEAFISLACAIICWRRLHSRIGIPLLEALCLFRTGGLGRTGRCDRECGRAGALGAAFPDPEGGRGGRQGGA